MEKLTYGEVFTRLNKQCYISENELEKIKDILIINSDKYRQKIFHYSCEDSDIELSKWLYSLIEANPNITKIGKDKIIHSAFYTSCCSGNLETAKWLNSLGIIMNIDNSAEATDLFVAISSCRNRQSYSSNWKKNDEHREIISEEKENKYLEVLKWYYNLGYNPEIRSAFNVSCSNGTMKIAEWLYSLDKNIYHMEAFRNACINGNLEMAKWIYEITPVDNTLIISHIEDIFITTCGSGHLDVAQWLYSKYNINIHAKDESAFRESCHNGYLDVAKWLYSVGEKTGKLVDIYAHDAILFKKYYNSKDEVIDWLNTLDKSQEMVNNKEPNLVFFLNNRCLVCSDKKRECVLLGCGHSLCTTCFHNLYVKCRIERECLACKKQVLFKDCFEEK